MYTEHFYDKILEEFDPPEMETSPLDKLVLRTKWIGQNIAPDESVRQLLSQAVQPPSLEQLEAAIERLADVGALTGRRAKTRTNPRGPTITPVKMSNGLLFSKCQNVLMRR